MFEQKKSAPWYKSRRLLLAIPILVILIGGLWAFNAWRRSSSREAHDLDLEADRRRQAEQAAAAGTPVQPTAPVAQPSASASPQNPAEAAQASQHAAAKNYWTNFRGPKRDGR